jgi:hypothetical protein
MRVAGYARIPAFSHVSVCRGTILYPLLLGLLICEQKNKERRTNTAITGQIKVHAATKEICAEQEMSQAWGDMCRTGNEPSMG